MKLAQIKAVGLIILLVVLFAAQPVSAFYNSDIGRWANRDPIGERGGINLYGFVNNNPAGFIDSLGLYVFVGNHPVGKPADPCNKSTLPNHAAIVLMPDNPQDFRNNPLFNNDFIATIGGQPNGGGFDMNPFGTLQTSFNNPGDQPQNLTDLTLVPTPPGMTDTQFINNLLNAANSYGNDEQYGPFPVGPYYNSNSYVSGIIDSVSGTSPALPNAGPGYNHPVPIPYAPH